MPGIDTGRNIAHHHRSDGDAVERRAIGGHRAIGRLVLHRSAALQAQRVGQFCRDRHVAGAGVEQKLDSRLPLTVPLVT